MDTEAIVLAPNTAPVVENKIASKISVSSLISFSIVSTSTETEVSPAGMVMGVLVESGV